MPRKTSKKKLLIPELIPETMWGKNVRAVISEENWDALRWSFQATKEPAKFTRIAAKKLELPTPAWDEPIKCYVCGVEQDDLELHELWSYDDKKLIQKLAGFIPVCEECHLSLHLGFAETIGQKEKAEQHLANINHWTKTELRKQVRKIFKKWRERSRKQYSLDLQYLKKWFSDTIIHLDWLEKKNRWAGNRLDAIDWAQRTLKSDAVILDTETTGLLEYDKVEVIELSVISMKGKVLYSSRYRPRYKIPREVIKIHGIFNKDVKRSPFFSEEYSSLLDILHSKTVIAYNKKFDQRVIERTCGLYKLLPPECIWECAMQTYRIFKKSSKWLPLPGSKHNSIDDCKAVLKLIKKMAKGRS